MKNINYKIGLVLTLILTGTLLMTGCSSTKEIAGNHNLNTSSSEHITSFDVFKNAGNKIDYFSVYYDSLGTITGTTTMDAVVITTDYVTSNAALNHSIQYKVGSNWKYDNYVRQTSTELMLNDYNTNIIQTKLLFPINQGYGNISYLGQETINSVFGNILCTKIKETLPDGSYALVWLHQKYFSLKEEYFTSQNIKSSERNVTGVNF